MEKLILILLSVNTIFFHQKPYFYTEIYEAILLADAILAGIILLVFLLSLFICKIRSFIKKTIYYFIGFWMLLVSIAYYAILQLDKYSEYSWIMIMIFVLTIVMTFLKMITDKIKHYNSP